MVRNASIRSSGWMHVSTESLSIVRIFGGTGVIEGDGEGGGDDEVGEDVLGSPEEEEEDGG